VLSAAERGRLEAKLAESERETGAQMVVAVFPSLEGDSLEDASFRLAEAWKVGRKGVDNGIVLVVFLKERRMRIEVGYGLEPVITDNVAAGIIRDAIAPRFRDQRYAAGLEAAVDEVFARVRGTPAPARAPARKTAPSTSTILLMVLVFGVIGVALLSALRNSAYTIDRRGIRSRRGGFWTGGGPWIGGSGWSGGGGWGGGGGGGGFSGGGGSFGGGGASGNW
jgi:uncharacterized protein